MQLVSTVHVNINLPSKFQIQMRLLANMFMTDDQEQK